jgi:serine protease Do/serine protease DegQ
MRAWTVCSITWARCLRLARLACVAALCLPGLTGVPNANAALPLDARGLPTLAPMLARVTQGVVNIAVSEPAPAITNPLLRDPVFRRFFSPGEPQQPEPETSSGSGVIIDAARGLVITNHHVIENARDIVITLKDRRQLKAQLIGADPPTDIALLRVSPERLSAVPIGDSDALAVGDFVVAIGNPFGIGQTVTSGIVSALGRSGLGIEGYEEFIQTDASINPGNSGGALVNLAGELIGINTALLGPSQGNVGIGFAIPAAMVQAVVQQLLRFGEVRRGRIGVASTDLTPDVAQRERLAAQEGALLTQIEADSPASRAGLQLRDVVVAINGRPVRSTSELRNRVGLVPVGEQVELKVLRGSQAMRVRLAVAEPGSIVTLGGEPVRELAGARVGSDETAAGADPVAEGAVLLAVARDSAAWRTGLRVGDRVLSVNRRRVRDAQSLSAALRASSKPWRFVLQRGDSRISVVLP